MRQRRLKDLDERMARYGKYMIDSPQQFRGNWHGFLDNGDDIYLEIGCGKGKFITEHALTDPGSSFIGIEGQESVIIRAAEKKCEAGIENLVLINGYVRDPEEIFDKSELSGIYLNFSDPWPKARHARRRLTHADFLKSYGRVIRPGGFVEIKTDNDDLFDFTLEQAEETGMEIEEMTRDLHGSDMACGKITTEYEEKFISRGKNINYVKLMNGDK